MDEDIVDAHVHLLPPRLAARVRAVFDTYLPGCLAYPQDPDEVLADLADNGVRQAWVLPYAHAPGVTDWLVPATDEHVRDLATRGHGVDLVLGVTTHPGDPDPAAVVGEAVRDRGARVLKLHCAVGGFRADDRRLDPVWSLCADLRLPVVLHAGKDPAGTSDERDIAEVDRVARRHPDVPLILAHAGEPAVASALALLDRHANLHADLTPVVAAVPAVSDADLLRHADRLLFGSDAPNTGHRVAALRDRLTSRGLDAPAVTSVLGGNARRLTAGVRL